MQGIKLGRKIMTTTEDLRKTIQDFKEKFETPYLAIEEGGNFNGTIYCKKVGNGRNFDLGVYVSNKYYPLGRFAAEHVQEIKEAFYLLLAEGFVQEDKQEAETVKQEAEQPLFLVKTKTGKVGKVYLHPEVDKMFKIKLDGKVGVIYQSDGIHYLSGCSHKKSYVTLGWPAIKDLFNLDRSSAKLEIISFGDGTELPQNGQPAQINELLSNYGANLNKSRIIKKMQKREKNPIPKVGKNAKWVNGMWVYPSGNYGEDVLSGYYEEG